MFPAKRKCLRVGVRVGLLVIMLAGPAFGQIDSDPSERWLDVPALEWEKPWLQWLTAAGFVAFCLLPAFKNPHRSHLD